jgi:ribosomal-protein-serine acetyltransferase
MTNLRPRTIDVLVHRQRRSRPRVTVHRTTYLDPREVTVRDRLPLTTPARTLLDLADVLDRRPLERALDNALGGELTTLPELHALIDGDRERLARWLSWAAEQNEAETLEYIRTTRRELADNVGFATGIVVDGRLAGAIGLMDIDRRHNAAELGYWLGSGHEGRGIMTAAVFAHVAYAFGALELHRLEIRAATGNARSQGVAERAGFTREGIERDAERIGDRDHDLVLFSRLSTPRGG